MGADATATPGPSTPPACRRKLAADALAEGMDEIAVVVAAGGRGSRAGGGLPKQYRPLAGRPLLAWTLESLAAGGLGPLQVVCAPERREICATALAGRGLPVPVAGGASRQRSVLCGLRALATAPPRHVMIHDAARPFVAPALIARLRQALAQGAAAAIPVLPVADALKRCRDGKAVATLERHGVARAQTPQAFDFAAILAAHERHAGSDLSDDAAVAAAAGMEVHTVAGDEDNLKITTTADLRRAAERLEWQRRELREMHETRVGTGFDVHAFAPGDHVMLCGVRIAHDAGLAGHSDADVGLHALVDAMLGALGEGDLGQLAPPGDPAWRGRDSADLVAAAGNIAARRRARLVHADITLICQRPRLAPHQDAMRARVARLLAVERSRVNVKATSSDGLGFTGRGEGIAAQAAVTLAIPGETPATMPAMP